MTPVTDRPRSGDRATSHAGWWDVLEPIRSGKASQLAVHLVANGVRGDSRVLKSAQVTQRLGLPTLLVGITPAESFESFELEGVPVLLVPFRGSRPTDVPAGLRPFAEAWPQAERAIMQLRTVRALRKGKPRSSLFPTNGSQQSEGGPGWASHQPTSSQIVLAFTELLRCVQPRLVHCHDLFPLPAAVAHASRERLSNRRVWTIYDAHESAISLVAHKPGTPAFQTMLAIEQEFIRDVNDVLTVSTEIAELLQTTYGLRNRPVSILNAPSSVRNEDAPSLRRVIGLPDTAHLAVYSGWIDAERRLDSTIKALVEIPSLHLAVVCAKLNPTAQQVWRLATELGVDDRLHFAEYVSPEQITQYLSSADLGIIPRGKGPHLDLSLPTKWREYLHAGLPVVVSQNKAMERETNRLGVGLVFNPYSLAGQVQQLKRVLSNRDEFTSRITPAALLEHSWEKQAETLAGRYIHGLAGNAVAEPTAQTSLSDAIRSLGGYGTTPADEIRVPRRIDARRQSVMVGVGPANYAGQAHQWSEVLRHAGVSAESFAAASPLCDGPHRAVKHESVRSIAGNAGELGLVASRYTHLLVDGFKPVAGSLFLDLGAELQVLKRHVTNVGLIAHGSDVRDPDRHMSRLEGSYFHTAPEEWTALLRRISAANQRIAATAACPVFVTTPDLLLDIESAIWLPLVVNFPTWEAVPHRRWTDPLRVLHRPSRADPPIKGSDVVIPALDRLEEEGLIEVVRADFTRHGDMPALLAQADVVVDQIRTGSYGVAAVEAMAAGRIVVGHVAPDVRDLVDDTIPIIDGPPESFERAMRTLASSPRETLDSLAKEGRKYARRWHDGRKALAVLEAFVDHTPAPHLNAG